MNDTANKRSISAMTGQEGQEPEATDGSGSPKKMTPWTQSVARVPLRSPYHPMEYHLNRVGTPQDPWISTERYDTPTWLQIKAVREKAEACLHEMITEMRAARVRRRQTVRVQRQEEGSAVGTAMMTLKHLAQEYRYFDETTRMGGAVQVFDVTTCEICGAELCAPNGAVVGASQADLREVGLSHRKRPADEDRFSEIYQARTCTPCR